MTTLERAEALAGRIAEDSARIDGERAIPRPLLDELARAGCFRMISLARHGGDELPLPAVLRVIARLARADGTVGWVVAQAALAQLVLLHLPADTNRQLYAASPDLLAAGAFAPKGRATRDGAGWRVSGRWPFASGVQHAAWVYVSCLVLEDRKVQLQANGLPLTRVMLLPAAEVDVHDTWRSLGLRGTSSHDVEVHKRFCPEERSCSLAEAAAATNEPLFRIQLIDYGSLFVAAVAVGVAAGALDDIVALAKVGKRPAFSRRRLAEDPIFQDRLGETFMRQLAATDLLHCQAERAWSVTRGATLGTVERASLRATSSHVTGLAARVVDQAHALAGGTSVYDSSPLQRRLRDIHTVSQHAWNGREPTTLLGAVLSGEPVDPMLFR